jgi:large subunit ribosomal protein L24e
MVDCSFCGENILPGRGVTLYKRDGTGQHYCSRKCEVNTRMGRNPRKLKWTTKFASSARKKKVEAAPAALATEAKPKEPKKKRLSSKARKIEAKKAEDAAAAAKAAAGKPAEAALAAKEEAGVAGTV